MDGDTVSGLRRGARSIPSKANHWYIQFTHTHKRHVSGSEGGQKETAQLEVVDRELLCAAWSGDERGDVERRSAAEHSTSVRPVGEPTILLLGTRADDESRRGTT